MTGSVKMMSKSGLFALVSMGLLAGCTGTSTYGTGVSQEGQLYEDLLGIAALGSNKKKKRIDYMSRPKLIKPPTVAALPTPAEKVESESGYFPKDPETARAARLAAIAEAEKNGGELPEEVLAARRAAAARSSVQRIDASDKMSAEVDPQLAKRQRALFLKQKGQRAGALGAAPRKYLTEPPKDYRTPEQTAAIGEVGEKEKSPYKRKTGGNILDTLLGKK